MWRGRTHEPTEREEKIQHMTYCSLPFRGTFERKTYSACWATTGAFPTTIWPPCRPWHMTWWATSLLVWNAFSWTTTSLPRFLSYTWTTCTFCEWCGIRSSVGSGVWVVVVGKRPRHGWRVWEENGSLIRRHRISAPAEWNTGTSIVCDGLQAFVEPTRCWEP